MPVTPRARRTRALLTGAVALTASAIVASLVVAPAHAAADDPQSGITGLVAPTASGPLSPRLAALRPAPGRDTALLAQAAGLPDTGPGSAQIDSRGRVLVETRVDDVDTALEALDELGEITSLSRPLHRVTLRIATADLDRLAALPHVVHADVVPEPLLLGAAAPASGPSADAVTAADGPTCGSVRSEADTQLRVAAARALAAVDGTGVPVGVLSDSFDASTTASTEAADDVKSGDLPGADNPCGRTTPVLVVDEIDDPSGAIDEGRAMLQLIHDLAPGSPLLFASAFNGGQDGMAANIRALAAAGAKVIVDDVSYFADPVFQPGVIDAAIADVTALGVTYLSSAGNSNVIYQGKDVASWETSQARLVPCGLLGGQCVDFDPRGSNDWGRSMTIKAGGQLTAVLQWAQSVEKVTTDFDLLLVDDATNEVYRNISTDNLASQQPVEYLSVRATQNVRVKLVIRLRAGAEKPRVKLLLARGDVTDVEYTSSEGPVVIGPTVFGHSGGPATISVGAVPFDNSAKVEDFSSRGPVTHYFGPVRAGGAAPLAQPQVITAPQVAATDGAATTFFASRYGSTWRFYGTSAAAPHAAAVAALLKQQNPARTPAQIRDRLMATAARVGTYPATAAGSGLVDGMAAVATAPGAPRITGTARGRGTATVSFAAPATLGAPALNAYTARCTSPAGATRSLTRSGASTAPLTVTGLTAGVSYRCTVSASNGIHATASAPGAAVVPTGVPARPAKPTVKAVKAGVKVTAKASANTGGLTITKYRAICTPVGKGPARSKESGKKKLKVKGLQPGAQYRCTVTARNSLGWGPVSPKSKKVATLR